MASKTNGYNEKLQAMADRYFDETGSESATTRDLAVWALKLGLWDAPADLVLKKCQEDFAKALREQYIEDAQGRPVRAKHAARVKRGDEQLHLWSDIRCASHEHMNIAFQQRREHIVGECRQLKRDVDYYNTERPKHADIQLVFDFTEDVEEGDFSSEFQTA